MSNNICKFNSIPSMPEKVLSALAYFTFGSVGILLLIASAILKTNLKPFVKLNVYQSILLGSIFLLFLVTYNLLSAILQFLQIIPWIGPFINSLFQFIIYYLMSFPLFLGLSFLTLLIIFILLYLSVITLLGKNPYIPYLSDYIKRYI